MVVFAAGVPLVDHQLVGALHPYVDTRGDEFFGRGFQRRAVKTVGHLVVLPRIVVVAFGNRAAVRFGRVVFAHARDDLETLGLHRVGVGLEDQRLGFRRAAEEHLRGNLFAVVVQDDDVFRSYAFERRHFGPGDFDRLVVAFELGRVGYIYLQGGGAGGHQHGCKPKNRVFHHTMLKDFLLDFRQIYDFSVHWSTKLANNLLYLAIFRIGSDVKFVILRCEKGRFAALRPDERL